LRPATLRLIGLMAVVVGLIGSPGAGQPAANELGETAPLFEDTRAADGPWSDVPLAAPSDPGRSDERNVVTPIDIACTPSWDAKANPINVVRLIHVGAGNSVVGIGWDVVLRSVHPSSWLSDIGVCITDSSAIGGFMLRPGSDNFPGGPTSYSSGGIQSLSNFGIPNLVPLADGLIRIEFFEAFDDALGQVDGEWACGQLAILTLAPTGGPPPGPVFFSSEAAFIASAGAGITSEGFDGLPAGNTRSTSAVTAGGVVVAPSAVCPMRSRIGIYNLTAAAVSNASAVDGSNFVFVVADPASIACPIGHSSTLTIDLPSPATAFGVHITDWGDFIPGATLTLSTPTGINHTIAMTPPGLGNGNAMFIGVSDPSMSFSRVVLASTALGEAFGIDRVMFRPHCSAPFACRREGGPPGSCRGDADGQGDGLVNFADITAILENWGAAYAPGYGSGNANDDGVVNFTDITEVLTFWGATCP
jgi:hypothetical protein